MTTKLTDCITSYLSRSKKSGACGEFTFDGDAGYLNGQKISKVVDGQIGGQIGGQKKRYLLLYLRIHDIYDVLIQIAGRLGVEEIVLPDKKLLDGAERWDELFFEWYAGHIRVAACADSDVQFKYRVVLANRTRHQAKSYAAVFSLDWDSVAHKLTPDYALKDDLDLLTQFALRDMGVENVYDERGF